MYTCTASSESGETSWSASLTVEESPGARLHRAPDPAMFPAAPSVPTIVNVTKNSVTVTWHPPTPHLGASPIIGYTLEYYSSDLQTGWVIAAHRISTNTMVVSIYTYTQRTWPRSTVRLMILPTRVGNFNNKTSEFPFRYTVAIGINFL